MGIAETIEVRHLETLEIKMQRSWDLGGQGTMAMEDGETKTIGDKDEEMMEDEDAKTVAGRETVGVDDTETGREGDEVTTENGHIESTGQPKDLLTWMDISHATGVNP